MRHLLYPPAAAMQITAQYQPTARLYHRRYLPQKPYRRILPPQAAVRLRIPRQTLLIKQAPTNRTVRHRTARTSKTAHPILLPKRQSLRQASRKAALLPLRQASLQTVQTLQQASLQTAQALQQASLHLQLPPIPPKSPPQQPLQKSLSQRLPQQP